MFDLAGLLGRLNTYEVLRLPLEPFLFLIFATVVLVFSVLLWQSIGAGPRSIQLTRKGKIISIFGLIFAFFLQTIPFIPLWDREIYEAHSSPACRIFLADSNSENFTLQWFSDSETPSISRIRQNGSGYEIVPSIGERKIDWQEDGKSQEYQLRVENRYDFCLTSVVVWHPDARSNGLPQCHLEVDRNAAIQGEKYRISWEIIGNEDTVAFINGTEVGTTGHANFTFKGPNYDRFRLVANSNGDTCQADRYVFHEGTWLPSPSNDFPSEGTDL